MLLTLSTTYAPATDLGYLLHKHPGRIQSFSLNFGQAHVFYPEAEPDKCTAALLLDVDAVGLIRRPHRESTDNFALTDYVSDRPYVASSFLSVAIARVFSSALSGNCKERPDLAAAAIPLTARISVLPCRGGQRVLSRLFEPLGYEVKAAPHGLPQLFPEWAESSYFTVTLEKVCTLRELLTHLYVLIPVLDDEKHYWVGDAEIQKLLRHGETWLGSHPEQEFIVRRYLKHQRRLTREALGQLREEDVEEAVQTGTEEETLEAPIRLNEVRLQRVTEALKMCRARRVLDLGCGEGKLVRKLLAEKQFEEIVAMDVSHRMLKMAQDRLRYDPDKHGDRLRFLQGSLGYRDERLAGYDAAAVVEVIEHLDPPRLSAFERVLFEVAAPATVVLTTPNVEYNVKFENLRAGNFRHADHRFEWTRDEFQTWASGICKQFGYEVVFSPIGETDASVGAPTQMAVFTRADRSGRGGEGERI